MPEHLDPVPDGVRPAGASAPVGTGPGGAASVLVPGPAPVHEEPRNLWHASLRWTSLGALVLVLLAAFESMAVTTIMPVVADDLDGESLYAVAFSATLAASVVAMVVAGGWSDRRGPSGPLLTAVGLFLGGLVIAGTALNMPVFVAGRFLQGLGGGAITVSLYVVVARAYPPSLHPRVFGMFSAAWVVPSMVGPYLAGVVVEATSWHWVFLGVAVLVLPALALLAPALRHVRGPAPDRHGYEPSAEAPERGPRLPFATLLAVVVAVVLVATGLLADVASGAWAWLGAAAALAVVAVAVRPLLPAGTLRAARGLPAVILLRGVIAAAYFGTEVYLPLMLQRSYGLSASRAGLVLTVGALAWATGSAVQARAGQRVPSRRFLVGGSVLVTAGIALQLTTALLTLGIPGALAGWLVGGLGMGLVYPRLSTEMIRFSTPRDQGFNSAALSIADAVGGAAVTAVTGLLLVGLGGATAAFAACFGLCLALAVLGIGVAGRSVRHPVAAARIGG